MSAPEQPDTHMEAFARLFGFIRRQSISGAYIKGAEEDLATIHAEVERLRAALNEVATHPAQDVNPGQAYEGDWMMAYRDGVRDGHRCAANIARAALEQAP